MKRLRFALAAAVALASSSCGQQTEVWQLTDFRILGVRAYPTSEPARNSPRHGERATLELVSADTQMRTVKVAWLIVNSAAFAVTGMSSGGDAGGSPLRLPALDLCDVDAFALDLGGISLRCGARTEFTVPMTGAPDARGRESLTVFGMACAGGRIRTIASSSEGGTANTGGVPFECRGEGSRGWPFQYTLLLGSTAGNTGNDNMHPRITAVRAGVRGSTLAPVTDGVIPTIPRCADQSRNSQCPRLRVEVDYNDGARETYPELDPNTQMNVQRTERLITGFIVSRGKLSGGFRTDSEADPMSVMGNDLLPPTEAGDVRMILYSTDGRGGFDSRELTLRVE
ncbi:MAG: hypothetical protein U0269_12720 [Polyangiales bacterium]